MTHEHHTYSAEIEAALDQLRAAITFRYMDATFDVFERDDPEGIRLRATVDVEDTDEILDTVIDLIYEIQVEQKLPIYVVPVQTAERATEELHARSRVSMTPSLLPPLHG